jgi:N-acetylmuramoyl-L-alanine amidase
MHIPSGKQLQLSFDNEEAIRGNKMINTKDYCFLGNCGHGGSGIAGCPTYGKQTPIIPETGKPLFHEGDIARKIGIRLKEKILESPFADKIKFELLNGYCNIDISLKDRVKYGKFVHQRLNPSFWLGIHVNAEGDGSTWTPANGARILYYGSKTRNLARLLMECHKRNSIIVVNGIKKVGIISGMIRMRPALYELRKTPGPALIYETGFMTNKSDAERISSDAGIEDAANTLFEFILITSGII